MSLLTAVGLHVQVGHQVLFRDLGCTIEPGQRIGLVGRNGTGKTTFLKVISGEREPDSGKVELRRGARVGLLRQDPEFMAGDTVRTAAARAFGPLIEAIASLEAVFDAMGEASQDELESLFAKQGRLEDQIEALGGRAWEHRVDEALAGVGLGDRMQQPVEGLSGGERGRLGLATLLLENPDVLLLDEPTNHLDIAGREWLENFLSETFRGAVLVVSHDRALLDRLVGTIVELDRGQLEVYPGNYSDFRVERVERRKTLIRTWEKQQDRIRHEQSFIDRYKAGQRARQAKGRASRLERMIEDEGLEKPLELDVVDLDLPNPPRSGDLVLRTEQLCVQRGDRVLISGLDLELRRGDRLGIVGPNGTGKTSLIATLLEETPASAGRLQIGSRLKTAWFRQRHEALDPSLVLWRHLQDTLSEGRGRDITEQEARNLAGAFLFSGTTQDKCVGDLSGGERSRLVLAGLLATAPNMLVLDEPTNHLDIPTAERLEQMLDPDAGWEGTMVLVSHDRALLDQVCTRLLILHPDGQHELFDGAWSAWRSRQVVSGAEPENKAGKTERSPSASRKAPTGPKNPHSHLSLEQLESKVMDLEEQLATVDLALGEPEVWSDPEKLKSLQDERTSIENELGPLSQEWERRASEMS